VPTELSCCLPCVQVLHNIALEIRSISLCITGDRCKDFLHAITYCTVHYVPRGITKSIDSFLPLLCFCWEIAALEAPSRFCSSAFPPTTHNTKGPRPRTFLSHLVKHDCPGLPSIIWTPALVAARATHAPSQVMVDLTSCPSELGAASTWCGIAPNRRRSVDRERRSPCQYGALCCLDLALNFMWTFSGPVA
jgi:hypothetical protein